MVVVMVGLGGGGGGREGEAGRLAGWLAGPGSRGPHKPRSSCGLHVIVAADL